MKDHVAKLDELAEMAEMMGDDGGAPAEMVDD
jgi:hypothetical protein